MEQKCKLNNRIGRTRNRYRRKVGFASFMPNAHIKEAELYPLVVIVNSEFRYRFLILH
jgi:hypothetical protein